MQWLPSQSLLLLSVAACRSVLRRRVMHKDGVVGVSVVVVGRRG